MGIHIHTEKNAVAEKVLLPGDPLRAKFIAENFLENAVCYNKVRGMYGFTGKYKGETISVQGTGMGMPSASIYIHELINDYGAKQLIRIGSCGALQDYVKVRDLVVPIAASSNSSMLNDVIPSAHFSPVADFEMLTKVIKQSERLNKKTWFGNVFSSDHFYDPEPNSWKLWAQNKILACEMECAALYISGARFGVQTLCILTVTDNNVTEESISPNEREQSLNDMIELALETLINY